MVRSSIQSDHTIATPILEPVTVARSSEMGEVEPSLDPIPTSSLYYSRHMESVMQRRSEFASEFDFEIECSKVHWSEVQTPDREVVESKRTHPREQPVTEVTDREVFERFVKHRLWCGLIFRDLGDELVLGRNILKGGQAEIFEARWSDYGWRRCLTKVSLC